MGLLLGLPVGQQVLLMPVLPLLLLLVMACRGAMWRQGRRTGVERRHGGEAWLDVPLGAACRYG